MSKCFKTVFNTVNQLCFNKNLKKKKTLSGKKKKKKNTVFNVPLLLDPQG